MYRQGRNRIGGSISKNKLATPSQIVSCLSFLTRRQWLTRQFLHLPGINGFSCLLVERVRDAGLLIGTNAGASLMTPTVALKECATLGTSG
jgi:hypothetical protein